MLKVTNRVSQTKPRVKHDTMIKMRLEEEDAFFFQQKQFTLLLQYNRSKAGPP